MDYVTLGTLKVSRFILGSNPFAGFSHQNPATDLAMKRFFTVAQIKATLREAEALGVNTVLGRTDNFMMRVLFEYWNEGGKIQWIAQSCPEYADNEASILRAASNGAKACFIHGGVMDNLFAQKKLDQVEPALKLISEQGMLAGVAAHNPQAIAWAEANVKVDFYMCCYYNSANRDQKAEHVSGMAEWFRDEDRTAMTEVIGTLSHPVIHYKVLAAGRNDPAAAFAYAAKQMRAGDMACVGICQKDNADMLKTDVRLLLDALTAKR